MVQTRLHSKRNSVDSGITRPTTGLCGHRSSGKKWNGSGKCYTATSGWSSWIFNSVKLHIWTLTGSRHIPLPPNYSHCFYGSATEVCLYEALGGYKVEVKPWSLWLAMHWLLCSSSSTPWQRFLPGTQVLTPALQLYPKLSSLYWKTQFNERSFERIVWPGPYSRNRDCLSG